MTAPARAVRIWRTVGFCPRAGLRGDAPGLHAGPGGASQGRPTTEVRSADRVAGARPGADRLILDLPLGYDTPVSHSGGRLSGGQIQRIGLARALYADPAIFVLDEPNSNLDNEGSEALNLAIRAIKARGGAVIIMAHRPAAIAECDLLLVMEQGTVRAFGPRDEVLKSTVRNAQEIRTAPVAAGGAA